MPQYGTGTLSGLLPGIALALGVDVGRPGVTLPPADRICVVVVDGLGYHLLTEYSSRAPFLGELLGESQVLRVGTPSTTATSMGSFGTGRPPGRHGLAGYRVMDPDRGVLMNELRWDPAVDPLRWQPYDTVFQELVAAGVSVTSIGNPEFEGSGLTTAALRGGRFQGRDRLHQRVETAVADLQDPGLVYLYWAKVDSAGHMYGSHSRQWRKALGLLDAGLARLAREMPVGTLLVITADHGMVDVGPEHRVDLAVRPDLQPGIDQLAGEARFAQAYCTPGSAVEVARRLQDAFGALAWVRTRDEAIEQGWYGPVDDRVRGRIGDVLIAAAGQFTFLDSRNVPPHELSLIGQHGSLTDAEQLVPLLQFRR